MTQDEFDKAWNERQRVSNRITEIRGELRKLEADFARLDAITLKAIKEAQAKP